jgi:hypothetical protein
MNRGVALAFEGLDQGPQLLDEQIEQIRFQIGVATIIIADHESGQQLGGVFPEQQLISVIVQRNIWARQKRIQNFDDYMILVL